MCFVFANFSWLTSNFLQSSNFHGVYFPKTLNVRGVLFYCTLSTSYRRVLLIKQSYPISARIRSTEQILQHDASLFASVIWILQSFSTPQGIRSLAIWLPQHPLGRRGVLVHRLYGASIYTDWAYLWWGVGNHLLFL